MAEKTMNTTLHIYEAYTQLYKVTADNRIKDSMIWILDIFADKIYNNQKHRLEVFFDKDMHSLIDLYSYGHDIESAWLLEYGLDIIGNIKLKNKYAPLFKDLENQVLLEGYNGESLAAECENGKVKENRIWWVQCEAITGFFNAFVKYNEPDYLNAVLNIWNYTKKYMIDKRTGSEWLNERFIDKSINKAEPILSLWKCPYHNSRMCIQMINRIDNYINNVNKI